MSKKLQNKLEKIEEKLLELELNNNKDTIDEIYSILNETLDTSTTEIHPLNSYSKKLYNQFKIIIEEIQKGEISLSKDTIFLLKLFLRDIEYGKKEEIKREEVSLIKEFFTEVEELLEELDKEDTNTTSLLHRLKGIVGIFISVCKEEDRELGIKLLEKTKKLEQKAKTNILLRKDIEELKKIFKKIRGEYEGIR